jgi:hypothetical protein
MFQLRVVLEGDEEESPPEKDECGLEEPRQRAVGDLLEVIPAANPE